MWGVNDEKNEVANTIEILEHIDGNNQDMVISMFYGRYYRSTNPFIEIQKICASCSCTYQTACKKYAVQVIENKQWIDQAVGKFPTAWNYLS